MTQLSAGQMQLFWKSSGGPDNRTVAWLSIAYAESSWVTDALSPTGAVGLYQVEPYSWPAQLGSFDLATDPAYNTLACLDLSGGGMNFAPWDTAYANIYASGRYSFLAWPETGSAAYNNFTFVAASLGANQYGNPGPPGRPGIDGSLPDAIGWYEQTSASAVPALSSQLRAISARIAGQYTGR